MVNGDVVRIGHRLWGEYSRSQPKSAKSGMMLMFRSQKQEIATGTHKFIVCSNTPQYQAIALRGPKIRPSLPVRKVFRCKIPEPDDTGRFSIAYVSNVIHMAYADGSEGFFECHKAGKGTLASVSNGRISLRPL